MLCFLFIKIKHIFLCVGVGFGLCVLFGLFSPIARADDLYGDNIYGDCPYSRACPNPEETPTQSPTPTSSPSPDPSPTSSPSTQYIPGSGSISPSPPPSGNSSASKDFLSFLEEGRIGRFLIQQPATIPIILFILLLIMALILSIQAGFEHRSIIQLRRAIEAMNSLQKDVRNFLLVFQHNLRTPLTGLLSALGLLKMKKVPGVDTTLELAQMLNADTNDIIGKIVSSLETVTVDDTLRKSGAVSMQQTMKQPNFWGPVVTVVVLTSLYHILTWRLIKLSFSFQLIILEMAVFFAGLIVLFTSMVYYRRTKERKKLLSQIQSETNRLASQRNSTVTNLYDSLFEQYQSVDRAINKFPETHDVILARSTIEEFGRILQKFAIVREVQDPDLQTKIGSESYDLVSEMGRVIDAVQSSIQTKLAIDIDTTALKARTHQGATGLVSFVLASVLDNAVKYSVDKGAIKVSLVTSGDLTQVRIENHSHNIAQINAEKIFEPFTRFEDNLTSDIQGVGISLFVCQIVIRRIGGDIMIHTKKPDLVICIVTLPLKIQQKTK